MKKAPTRKRVAATAKKYPVLAAEASVAERVPPRGHLLPPLRHGALTGRSRPLSMGQTVRPPRIVHRDLSPEGNSAFHREALGLFIAIADRWALTVSQRLTILGKPATSASTYHHWKHAVAEHKPIQDNPDLIDRIAYVVGIFEGAGRFWGTPERAIAWLIQPNKALIFKEQSPLAKMLEGRMEDLRLTCAYIESAAGGAW